MIKRVHTSLPLKDNEYQGYISIIESENSFVKIALVGHGEWLRVSSAHFTKEEIQQIRDHLTFLLEA